MSLQQAFQATLRLLTTFLVRYKFRIRKKKKKICQTLVNLKLLIVINFELQYLLALYLEKNKYWVAIKIKIF